MKLERSDDESLVFEAVVPAAKVRCLDWRSCPCQCQREGGELTAFQQRSWATLHDTAEMR